MVFFERYDVALVGPFATGGKNIKATTRPSELEARFPSMDPFIFPSTPSAPIFWGRSFGTFLGGPFGC